MSDRITHAVDAEAGTLTITVPLNRVRSWTIRERNPVRSLAGFVGYQGPRAHTVDIDLSDDRDQESFALHTDEATQAQVVAWIERNRR